jgi:hypothetical protein
MKSKYFVEDRLVEMGESLDTNAMKHIVGGENSSGTGDTRCSTSGVEFDCYDPSTHDANGDCVITSKGFDS